MPSMSSFQPINHIMTELSPIWRRKRRHDDTPKALQRNPRAADANRLLTRRSDKFDSPARLTCGDIFASRSWFSPRSRYIYREVADPCSGRFGNHQREGFSGAPLNAHSMVTSPLGHLCPEYCPGRGFRPPTDRGNSCLLWTHPAVRTRRCSLGRYPRITEISPQPGHR